MSEQTGMNSLLREERNWTEDFPHENGKYLNTCSSCGKGFLGYKRRVICKLCAAPPPSLWRRITKFRQIELGDERIVLYLFQDRRYELGITLDIYEKPALLSINFIFIHLEIMFYKKRPQ